MAAFMIIAHKGRDETSRNGTSHQRKSPYISFPRSYKGQIDIDNDGVLENAILTRGGGGDILVRFGYIEMVN